MAAGEVDLLARPETPGAHHQKSAQPDQDQPQNRNPPRFDRICRRKSEPWPPASPPPPESACLQNTSGPAVPDCAAAASWLMLKRASREAPPIRKRKRNESTRLHQVLMQLRVDRVRQKMKTPDISQQAGRDAKCDHVRQRIQFLAEIARRIRHAAQCAHRARQMGSRKEWQWRPSPGAYAHRRFRRWPQWSAVIEKYPAAIFPR